MKGLQDIDSLKWDVIRRAAAVAEAWRKSNAYQRAKLGPRIRRLAASLDRLHEAVNP